MVQFDRLDICETCGGPVRVKVDGDIAIIESMNQWQRLGDLVKQLELANQTAKKLLLALEDRQ